MLKEKVFALVDCNNFFVSCERIFRPDLQKKPVIVLSNNDGCAVARSQEVKDFGVPMGAPYFKIENIVKEKGITLFSSNFELYGDISNRVMTLLEEYSSECEIYSIDEAFLNLTDVNKKRLNLIGEDLVRRVKMEVGIPVSVGIGATKTLAKIANEFAKKERRFNSTTNLVNLKEKELDDILSQIPIGDIWGIGRNRNIFLQSNGIYTAKDFKYTSQPWVRKHLSVMGERTYLELHGVSCFNLDKNPTPKKGIASTRSFGKYITKYERIEEAVATYTANAIRKLRKQNSLANHITVYIRTNKFKEDKYSSAYTESLPAYSNYTPTFIKHAKNALKKIFKPGLKYQKAGVYITGIRQLEDSPLGLFSSLQEKDEEKKRQVMVQLDFLNKKYGREIIRAATQGIDQSWRVKAEMISQRYTTKWNEILEINI